MNQADQKFFDDLVKVIREELDIPEPQQKDEFTARQFAEHVLHASVDTARRFLEKKVIEGKVTVRRRVLFTHGIVRGCRLGDVYKVNRRGKHVR